MSKWEMSGHLLWGGENLKRGLGKVMGKKQDVWSSLWPVAEGKPVLPLSLRGWVRTQGRSLNRAVALRSHIGNTGRRTIETHDPNPLFSLW